MMVMRHGGGVVGKIDVEVKEVVRAAKCGQESGSGKGGPAGWQ